MDAVVLIEIDALHGGAHATDRSLAYRIRESRKSDHAPVMIRIGFPAQQR